MAATNEHRIVNKILTDRSLGPALERGVTGEWFFNESHRDAFEFLVRHNERYGHVPTRPTFQKQMGNTYQIFAVHESLDYLLDEQAETCRWSLAQRMLPDVEDALKDGATEAAVDHIRGYLSKIEGYSPVPTSTVDAMHSIRLDEREDEYHERASSSSGGIIGLTTGFPTIDRTTLGLQPGHLVTVLAQPKTGKTTVCLAIANHVYAVEEEPVLFISLEMATREMEMRQDCLMAGVPFRGLQTGTLTALEMDKYQDWLDRARKFPHSFWFMDSSMGGTVSAVRAHIQRLKPSLMVLDGVYMLEDEQSGERNTWMALTNITRSLKRVAVQTGIPIIINTQALASKSKGANITMDSAGYTSSFGQDSDVVLGIEKIEMHTGGGRVGTYYETSRNLRVLASRNSGLAKVEIDFDFTTGKVAEMSAT